MTEQLEDRGALRAVALALASWFGVGFLPVAPGTWGTLAALPLAWAVSRLPTAWQALVAVAVALVGMPVAARAGRTLGVVDARQIVIDEVAGLLITMVGVRFTWASALAAFALFRLFDVLKPWPASFFDRKVKNGAGVVLDDVAAGLYSRGVLALLVWLLPGAFG